MVRTRTTPEATSTTAAAPRQSVRRLRAKNHAKNRRTTPAAVVAARRKITEWVRGVANPGGDDRAASADTTCACVMRIAHHILLDLHNGDRLFYRTGIPDAQLILCKCHRTAADHDAGALFAVRDIICTFTRGTGAPRSALVAWDGYDLPTLEPVDLLRKNGGDVIRKILDRHAAKTQGQ